MSEIPLAPSEEYKAPSSSGSRTKLIAIVVIAVVVVGGLVAVVVVNNSSPVYDTRQITSWTDADVEPSTTTYYRNSFTTSSAETVRLPYLRAVVTIDNGYDTGSVGIEFHVYECSVAIVDAAASWGDLAIYREGLRTEYTSMDERISLENDPSSYTWVLIFTYTGTKSATWDCDMTITLEY